MSESTQARVAETYNGASPVRLIPAHRGQSTQQPANPDLGTLLNGVADEMGDAARLLTEGDRGEALKTIAYAANTLSILTRCGVLQETAARLSKRPTAPALRALAEQVTDAADYFQVGDVDSYKRGLAFLALAANSLRNMAAAVSA